MATSETGLGVGNGQPHRDEEVAGLAEVLALVLERTGLDLRLYRRATLQRRLDGRLSKLCCHDYTQYAQLLAQDPLEARRLVEHVTIKVSRFFRDHTTYTRLREIVLPRMQLRLAQRSDLRLWSAGCGNGEEPYSLAILLREALGDRWDQNGRVGGEHEGRRAEVSIYGSDVDEAALDFARAGAYTGDALEETSPELVAKYFDAHPSPRGRRYQLRPELRERVNFVRHNLLAARSGPDPNGFDLILCRNVLIYLGTEAQRLVLDLLTNSLCPGGFLCLGEVEQLPDDYLKICEVIDRKARLYRRIPHEQLNPTGGEQA